MTLAEFSFVLEIEPKRVLNTMKALQRRTYSLELARRLAVAFAIQDATRGSLARAFRQAGLLLRRPASDATHLLRAEGSAVGLSVDLTRLLSSFNVRLSALRSSFAPRQRGRPLIRRRNPLAAAAAWGIDLSLVADNLRKTPEQRVRQLDGMAAWAHAVHRVAAPGH